MVEEKEGWGTQVLKVILLLGLFLCVVSFFGFVFNLISNPDYSELISLHGKVSSLEQENKDLRVLLDNSFPFNLLFYYNSIINLFLLGLFVIWFLKGLLNPFGFCDAYTRFTRGNKRS